MHARADRRSRGGSCAHHCPWVRTTQPPVSVPRGGRRRYAPRATWRPETTSSSFRRGRRSGGGSVGGWELSLTREQGKDAEIFWGTLEGSPSAVASRDQGNGLVAVLEQHRLLADRLARDPHRPHADREPREVMLDCGHVAPGLGATRGTSRGTTNSLFQETKPSLVPTAPRSCCTSRRYPPRCTPRCPRRRLHRDPLGWARTW